jgi:hypothetical protein
MTDKEKDWVEKELKKLWHEKLVDPIEEKAAFHIMCLPPHPGYL